MSTDLQHVLDGGPLESRRSVITGRTIVVNPDDNRFVVRSGWNPQTLAAARRDFDLLLQEGTSAQTANPGGRAATTDSVRRACAAFCQPVLEARSRGELLAALDRRLDLFLRHGRTVKATPVTPAEVLAIVREVMPLRSDAGSTNLARTVLLRTTWMLTTLWRYGLLVAPSGDGAILGRHFTAASLPAIDAKGYGDFVPLLVELSDVPNAARKCEKDRDRTEHFRLAAIRLLLTTQGVTEIGDFDHATLAPLAPALSGVCVAPGMLLDAIHRCQQRAYRSDLAPLRTLLPGRGARITTPRTDPSFRWMSNELPHFPLWRDAAVRWAGEQASRLTHGRACAGLAVILNKILAAEAIPVRPRDYCARSFDGAARIRLILEALSPSSSNRRRASRHLVTFFESVLAADARRKDGSINPAYHNPAAAVRLKRSTRRPGQTQRVPIRPWLVREIREILSTEDWARTLSDDYFVHTDPTSGLERRVWSPVRLEVFRLRFLLPLRTVQVQLLDSGEGDSRVWRADPDAPLDGAWVPNGGAWQPPAHERRQLGILRPIFDADLGRELTGLYINTNKTGDATTAFEQLGYEIPWESAEIIALILRVRAWQAQYNPSRGPRKRTEIQTRGDIATPDVEALLPAYHYLFRDACHPTRPMDPVTTDRLRNFWVKLLDTCEERLNARVRTGDPTGRSVSLITQRTDSGAPRKARYDLHSLRVTGLTELAVNGCPVQVLMALAGHATWVMTLYYVKLSPSDIQRELRFARTRAQETMDAETWEQVVASGDLDSFRNYPLGNSDDAIAARDSYAPDMWRFMDYGECPNGGTLCDIGGELLHRNPRDGDRHGPVEGGQRNCTSCRFFTYTPLHLLGLIARANALLLDVQAAGDRLRAAEQARRDLLAASGNAPDGAALRSRLVRADAAVESAEEHAVMVAKAFQTTHRCIARAKATLHRDMAAPQADDARGLKLPMLLNGTPDDLRVSFERCTDYDLWTRICEDAAMYTSIDPTSAALRRAARLDRMLMASGEPAVFATLTDDERVAVGNMYARWLRAKLGPVDHAAVISGDRTLRELGIIDESTAILAPVRGSVPVAPPLRALAAPRTLVGMTTPDHERIAPR